MAMAYISTNRRFILQGVAEYGHFLGFTFVTENWRIFSTAKTNYSGVQLRRDASK